MLKSAKCSPMGAVAGSMQMLSVRLRLSSGGFWRNAQGGHGFGAHRSGHSYKNLWLKSNETIRGTHGKNNPDR